jgi:hypothetical protein
MKIPSEPTSLSSLADVAISGAIKGVNFSLKQLLQRAADQLDCGQSRVRLEFCRSKSGEWLWRARLRDEKGKTECIGDGPGPLEAIVSLVEKISQ